MPTNDRRTSSPLLLNSEQNMGRRSGHTHTHSHTMIPSRSQTHKAAEKLDTAISFTFQAQPFRFHSRGRAGLGRGLELYTTNEHHSPQKQKQKQQPPRVLKDIQQGPSERYGGPIKTAINMFTPVYPFAGSRQSVANEREYNGLITIIKYGVVQRG